MSLGIHPDPDAPAGGYALLGLPAGTLAGETVDVALRERVGGRWLGVSDEADAPVAVGNPNWQAERHAFGPYPIQRQHSADWIRIGPEIVNKIEEYTPLQIEVGGQSHDVQWPDDVPVRAGLAGLGGLQIAQPAASPAAPAPLVATPKPAVDPRPDPEPDPDDSEPAHRPVWPWVTAAIVAMIAVAAGIYVWTAWQTGEETAPGPGTAEVAPLAPQGPACTMADLEAAGPDFAGIETAIRGCVGTVTPEVTLRLVETAAAREDPAALYLFGLLYDGTITDAEVETGIGLTFPDNPSRAAEYYARAVAAGSVSAEPRLAATCAQLAQLTSTLARGAYDDYCN